MNRLALLSLVAPLGALAACNQTAEGADPGPISQEEAEAIDDAASMLDEQRLTEEMPQPESTEGDAE